jgi:hypothetical protein
VKSKQPSITWQVDDGPVHEIPEGAKVTFKLASGKRRSIQFGDDGMCVLYVEEEIYDGEKK